MSIGDAKSLYDHLSTETPGGANDRRTAIDIQIIRSSMGAQGATVRWVDHGGMYADAMTKRNGNIPLRQSLPGKAQNAMHVLLDVHLAINDQQSAVACGIASSHEDLHEVTSISSCADPNSQRVSFKVLLGIPINNQNSFPSINYSNNCFGPQSVPPTSLRYGQIHHNLRINFVIHHEVLHDFFTHHAVLNRFCIHDTVLNQFFIHRDLLLNFSKFSNSHDLRITNQLSSARALRHVMFPTNSFNSLLLRSLVSSPRYQSNTSLM